VHSHHPPVYKEVEPGYRHIDEDALEPGGDILDTSLIHPPSEALELIYIIFMFDVTLFKEL
jgi:hypothetical protein